MIKVTIGGFSVLRWSSTKKQWQLTCGIHFCT